MKNNENDERVVRYNMEKCAAFVAKMILKYGQEVLEELESAKKEESDSWEE